MSRLLALCLLASLPTCLLADPGTGGPEAAALGAAGRFPGQDPGPAVATVVGQTLVLENSVFRARWSTTGSHLRLLDAGSPQSPVSIPGEDAFIIKLKGGRIVRSSELALTSKMQFQSTALEGDRSAFSASARAFGQAFRANLTGSGILCQWQASLRDGAGYARVTVRVSALELGQTVELDEIQLLGGWQQSGYGLKPVGDTGMRGGLLAGKGLIAALEHPFAVTGDASLPDGQLILDSKEPGEHKGAATWEFDVSAHVQPGAKLIPYVDNWQSHLKVMIKKMQLFRVHDRGSEILVVEDTHLGEASSSPKGNMYQLQLPTDLTWGRYLLRVSYEGLGYYDGSLVLGLNRKGMEGYISCALPWGQQLAAGESVEASLLLAAAPPDHLNEAVLHYVENERPRKAAPLLHYNSWYDIGTGRPYTEQDAIGVVHSMGSALGRRGITVDAYLLDDGWDDPEGPLWDFNSGFSAKAQKLREAAASYGSALGFW
ncbi:unnamed protein product, partial [Polarella glacialis]